VDKVGLCKVVLDLDSLVNSKTSQNSRVLEEDTEVEEAAMVVQAFKAIKEAGNRIKEEVATLGTEEEEEMADFLEDHNNKITNKINSVVILEEVLETPLKLLHHSVNHPVTNLETLANNLKVGFLVNHKAFNRIKINRSKINFKKRPKFAETSKMGTASMEINVNLNIQYCYLQLWEDSCNSSHNSRLNRIWVFKLCLMLLLAVEEPFLVKEDKIKQTINHLEAPKDLCSSKISSNSHK
jgi:hypothetical protein